jgi:hypothetical protein
MSDEFGQLTEKELEVGYWWVTHRLKIKAALILTAILVIVVIYLNAGIRFYQYLAGSAEHQAMLEELTSNAVNYEIIHKSSAPAPVLIGNSLAVGDMVSGYDLVTLVENSNNRWWLKEIEYQYIGSHTTTAPQITYLLPNEKKYLFAFNTPVDFDPVNAKIFITRQLWEKVKDNNQVDAKKQWIKPDLYAENINYQSSDMFFNEAKVTFDLVNDSSYSFWEVEVQILLWQGNRLLGVNVVTLDDILATSKRTVSSIWPNALPAGLRTEIIISANSLSEDNIQVPKYDLPTTIR